MLQLAITTSSLLFFFYSDEYHDQKQLEEGGGIIWLPLKSHSASLRLAKAGT